MRKITPLDLTVLAMALVCVASCSAAHKLQKKEAHFRECVREFNTQLRTQDFVKASVYVKESQQDQFVDFYERKRETYEIVDIDFISTKLDKKDSNLGKARLWVSFLSLPDPNLKKELRTQEWEYDADKKTWKIQIPEFRLGLKPETKPEQSK